MKLEATIVLSLQAPNLAQAGETLDDVLRRAAERSDVDVQSVLVQTPRGGGPVSLPQPPLPERRSPFPQPMTNGAS